MAAPPPQLRVLGTRSEHSKRFKGDISTLLASVLKSDPGLSPQEAMWKVQENLLQNNPYVPPKNGACIINSLPVELLAHIFRVGVEMQREGGNDDEFEEVREGTKEKEGLQKELVRMRESEQYEDSSDEEEDPQNVDPATVEVDDNNSEWEDEDAAEGSDEDMDEDEDEDEDDDEDDDDDESTDDESEHVPFEILVSHVCRHWREAALNTPDLWTDIYMEAPHQWRRYKAYIDRAKAQALDLDITIEDGEIPSSTMNEDGTAEIDVDEIPAILALIVPKAEQWRSVTFTTDFWRDAQQVLKALAQIPAAPLLETFNFQNYEEGEDEETFFPPELKEPFYLPFHGNTPNLKHVILWSVHIDWDGAMSMFQGLRELELGYHTKDVRPSWRAFSSYLKNSPQLGRLELKESGPKLDNPAGLLLPPVTPATGMPSAYYTAVPSFPEEQEEGDPYEWPRYPLEVSNLSDLILSEHDPAYATALISKLHFPKLKFLSLFYTADDFTEFVETCSQPLRGANSRRSLFQIIEGLEIKALGTVRIPAFEGMVAALGGLKHLALDCSDDYDDESHAVPQSMWKKLSTNTRAVADALKAQQQNQKPAATSQSVPATPLNPTPASNAMSVDSTPAVASAAVAALSIVPPSPSAPLPPLAPGASSAPAPTPVPNSQFLSSLPVQLLFPHLEGMRTRAINGRDLRRFYKRRLKLGVPLKQLHMHDSDERSKDEERWFYEHLENFEFYSDDEEEEEEDDDEDEDDEDDLDLAEEWTDEDGDGMDEDDDEWEDEDEDGGDDDDDDLDGDDGEGGGRVQTRRGPNVHASGAASTSVTTGLANMD